MDQKDKNNLKGMITRCLNDADLIDLMGILVPIFRYSLTDEIFDFLRKKREFIMNVYEQADIQEMIISKTAELIRYDELSKKFKIKSEDDKVLNHGKLKNFLKEKRINDVASHILTGLVAPEYSYALVKFPNIQLNSNMTINDDLVLIKHLEVDDEKKGYFRIREETKKYFSFQFEEDNNYLLIRQIGLNYRVLPTSSQEPMVFKNIKQKLKTFIGLSLIRGIFGITNMSATQEKRKSNSPIGVFVEIEWDEGARLSDDSEDYDLIPENHEAFEDFRSIWSDGDDLRYYSFQKRFFLEHEIELPKTLTDLINSLCIGEKITRTVLNLEKGKIVPLPLPHVEKAKSLREHLGEEFNRIERLLDSSDEYAERIKAASLWYLEGYCADNDTFKFINYTVAIESLLGDESDKNITQALSNKCGFWLGKGLQEKEEIRQSFKKRIYPTRSKIVHSGKTILKKEDHEILKELEVIAKRIIKEAIETYSP